MIEIEVKDIKDKSEIVVGKRLKAKGFFRRGAPSKEIKDAELKFEQIKKWYLEGIVLIDFQELQELDSIGIRNTIPLIIELNKALLSKKRTLISILGNKKSDIYFAIKDKFPGLDFEENLPWLETEEDFKKYYEI